MDHVRSLSPHNIFYRRGLSFLAVQPKEALFKPVSNYIYADCSVISIPVSLFSEVSGQSDVSPLCSSISGSGKVIYRLGKPMLTGSRNRDVRSSRRCAPISCYHGQLIRKQCLFSFTIIINMVLALASAHVVEEA